MYICFRCALNVSQYSAGFVSGTSVHSVTSSVASHYNCRITTYVSVTWISSSHTYLFWRSCWFQSHFFLGLKHGVYYTGGLKGVFFGTVPTVAHGWICSSHILTRSLDFSFKLVPCGQSEWQTWQIPTGNRVKQLSGALWHRKPWEPRSHIHYIISTASEHNPKNWIWLKGA